ncbi:MAG TPA: efflux RND transporter periplasmic adaptor subunit [Hyphomicrobiales bacterium]|nr:efflux RND transporter periplasmic adaptor subunit [Hyphomicrobiales bacterium]
MSDTSVSHPYALRSKRRRRLFGGAAALAVVLGAYWYWQNGRQATEDDEPLLALVERGDIENTIASAGTLKPSRFVDVGAQVSGQLQRLHVEVGDVVEEGSLLAEIDARVQESRVEASRASIAAQQAQLEGRRAALTLARANADRQQRLRLEDATSQLEYDTAINNLSSAESSLLQLQRQIEQSQASLASEETQLEYTKIYAPVSGTVVTIEMNEGRTLNANQQAPTILRIADLGTMTVEADISEADIGSIRSGMEVYFTTLGSGARRWYSTVRQVLPTPAVENNVVLYTGLFDIENSDGALFSEMTAQVYFITSSAKNVLTVPMGALSFLPAGTPQAAPRQAPAAAPQGGSLPPAEGDAALALGRGLGINPGSASGRPRPATVTVVKADGSREDRQVLIGVTSRVLAEVVSGLQEGEQVIAGILQSAAQRAAGQQNFGPGGFPGGGVIRRF